MMAPSKVWFAVVLVAIGFTANQARADQVIATLSSGNPLGPAAGPLNLFLSTSSGPIRINGYSPGEMNWTANNNSVVAQNNGKFTSFCIEIPQSVSPGQQVSYNLSQLQNSSIPTSSTASAATKASEIKQLWTAFFGSIGNDGTKAAAFQLAIWKIEYDWGDASMSAAAFKSNTVFTAPTGFFEASGNSAVTNLATQWLSDLENNTYSQANLMALTNGNYQDQVVAVPVPLPVPPGFALAGMSALCLGGLGLAKLRSRLLKPIAA